MSFDAMKVADLREVAETFGVEHEEAKNKNELVALLAEEGVTYDMYKSFQDAEKGELEDEEVFVDVPVKVEKPSTKKAKDTVLVRMERKNSSYETYGHMFTADHPFVAMPQTVAQDIFDNEEGFRMATPREVQEFYS
jgi:hypothetical protein